MSTTDLKAVFGDVPIGRDTTNKFKLSLNGLAVQVSENSYRTYDAKKDELVDAITFDFGGAANLIFRLPVPMNQLKKGDIIVVKEENPFTAYFVVEAPRDAKSIKVISPEGTSGLNHTPSTSAFSPSGPPFVIKVTSLIARPGGEFSLEKLLPFLILSDRGGNAGSGDDLLTTLLLANALGVGGTKGVLAEGNLLPLLALGGKGSNLGAMALAMGAASGQPEPPPAPAKTA